MNQRINKYNKYNYSDDYRNSRALIGREWRHIPLYFHPPLIFKMAASRFLNVSEKEIKIRKENAIPRNTKNAAESLDWHFSKVRCENCAKYNKETFLNLLENVAYVDIHE